MTSIEWLINELNHCLENNGFIEITPNLLSKLGNQAKEMHKQEIVDAFKSGLKSPLLTPKKWHNFPNRNIR